MGCCSHLESEGSELIPDYSQRYQEAIGVTKGMSDMLDDLTEWHRRTSFDPTIGKGMTPDSIRFLNPSLRVLPSLRCRCSSYVLLRQGQSMLADRNGDQFLTQIKLKGGRNNKANGVHMPGLYERNITIPLFNALGARDGPRALPKLLQ